MRTLVSLFEESAAKFADNPYVYQKEENVYKAYTYKQVKERVHWFAAGLQQMGLNPGDRVSLLAEGRLDWITAELGVVYNCAVNVPLSVKLSPEEVMFRLNHSGSRYIITTNRQLDKVLAVRDKITTVEKIILLDAPLSIDNGIIGIDTILSNGKVFLENKEPDFKARIHSVKEDDYANICYTSGTTADPKGIILSHRNYTANVEQSNTLMPVPEWYSTLLILPWDHAFAHTCGIYTLMKNGASLACIDLGKTPMDTLKNIPINIKETKPVFLLSVPALAKNFRKNIENGIRSKGPLVNALFKNSLFFAYAYNGNGWNKGKALRKLLFPFVKLYDKILFKKIREGFGGKLEFFVGGGALLDIELQRFFYAIGIPMFQGYGLSEAAPVISSNSHSKHKMGSSGAIADFMDVKIYDEDGNQMPVGQKGEIVVRGENVMKGYWNNPAATAEALKGEWLYTGDLGYFDSDGFLYVLGRSKSLLIADDGEKFSPEGIEEALTDHSPLIEQCMLYNNQKPYTVCLMVVNTEALKRYARQHHIDVSDSHGQEHLLKTIEKEINAFRTGGHFEDMFPQRWLPAAIGILDQAFTEENQLLNSTLKMVRPKITERYAERIEFLYTPEAKKIHNSKNIESLRKILS
ncbi:MAG: AMP-binding protein [Bacteroidota bacterium]|nr:MAG: AMP-binding protein [Bacteroidota bacterium]